MMVLLQNFELDFLPKTSQSLNRGHEAQVDLGMLPPCGFTISKRVLQNLTGGPEDKTRQKITAPSMDIRDCTAPSRL